jgi:hypothetical protein
MYSDASKPSGLTIDELCGKTPRREMPNLPIDPSLRRREVRTQAGSGDELARTGLFADVERLLLGAPEGRKIEPLGEGERSERLGVAPFDNRPDNLGR